MGCSFTTDGSLLIALLCGCPFTMTATCFSARRCGDSRVWQSSPGGTTYEGTQACHALKMSPRFLTLRWLIAWSEYRCRLVKLRLTASTFVDAQDVEPFVSSQATIRPLPAMHDARLPQGMSLRFMMCRLRSAHFFTHFFEQLSVVGYIAFQVRRGSPTVLCSPGSSSMPIAENSELTIALPPHHCASLE